MFEDLFTPRVTFYRRTIVDNQIVVSTGTMEGSGVYVVLIVFENQAYPLDRLKVSTADDLEVVNLYHSQIVEEILCGANTFDVIADPNYSLGEEPRKEITLDFSVVDELNVQELTAEEKVSDYISTHIGS